MFSEKFLESGQSWAVQNADKGRLSQMQAWIIFSAGRNYIDKTNEFRQQLRRNLIQIHDDLVMFRSFFDDSAPDFNSTIPFMIRRGVHAETISFYADAAGAANLGFGCTFKNKWAQDAWRETNVFVHPFHPNITLLELFAIVMAIELWARDIAGTELILHSDNEATCFWINKKRSKIPAAMKLLRHLTLKCLSFQIHVSALHIAGTANRTSDLISHFHMDEFFRENSQMDPLPTPLPSTLWPISWSAEDMLPRKNQ